MEYLLFCLAAIMVILQGVILVVTVKEGKELRSYLPESRRYVGDYSGYVESFNHDRMAKDLGL